MADFYNLDLEYIKDDIKGYIRDNSEVLKDYNYEGSAISNMINVLAYVTQYNMFYLNSVTKELFLSSAQLANSVYRLANMLNYIPKRNVSASCDVLITNNSTENKYLYFGSEFSANDITMTYMGDLVTILPNSSVTVSLNQGEIVTQNWISDGTPFQTYRLNFKEQVDDTYISVGVGNSTKMNYDWVNINKENPIIGGKYFYIDYLDQMFIKFDNGLLYQMPNANQIVGVRYLKTDGNLYSDTIMTGSEASTPDVSLTAVCVSDFSDGANDESLDEIKSRAILNYTTQNRTITESDYNIFFTRYPGYSEFKDALIFGGDKVYIDVNGNEIEYVAGNSWQDVGYVYVVALKDSDDIYNFTYLSSADRTSIENFFAPYKVITLFFKFVDPILVYFNPKFRIKMKSMVELDSSAFKGEVDGYLYDTYTGMDLTLSKSNIIKYIDSLPNVNYSALEYDFFAKCYKGSETYTVIPLGSELNDVFGHYFDCGTVSEKVEVGFTIKSGVNEARIIDVNNHEEETLGYFSVDLLDSSTFADSTTIGIYNREDSLLTTCTLSEISRLYIDSISSTASLLLSTTSSTATIGTVNCDTGFIVIDDYGTTILNDMKTFTFNFTLEDDISFTAKREVFLCPEPSTITYL